jgi:AcrR family transcriptional regulator
VTADAKKRLLTAARDIFGSVNLEGATTRQIAERAGVNQAAIPYYFGGKEGLYQAVIQQFLGEKFGFVQPTVAAIREKLSEHQSSKEEAFVLLEQLLTKMLETVLLQDASSTWARIVMREQMQPTAAFDMLYARAIRHVHETVSTLLGIILGRSANDPMVILRAHMWAGQVLIFLSGRETIRRRLSLDAYSEDVVALILKAMREQLAILKTEIAH